MSAIRMEAYYNLHKQCLSARPMGGRVQHYRWLNMRDVTFAVQPAGRAKVLKERRKNVHAFVRGLVDSSQLLESNDWNCKPCDMNTLERFYDEVRYNPYLYESFVHKESEEPIFETPHALIMGRRIFVQKGGLVHNAT